MESARGRFAMELWLLGRRRFLVLACGQVQNVILGFLGLCGFLSEY